MWPTLTDQEKKQLCEEAGTMVRALGRLTRSREEKFIGSIGGQPLGDRLFFGRVLKAFPDADAFYTFWTNLKPSMREFAHQFPELPPLPYGDPFVFTHSHLGFCNIMVTRRTAKAPLRIAAIIDWEQSGWLPEMWEPCKTRMMPCVMSGEVREDVAKYVPLVAGIAPDHLYEAFMTYLMNRGAY
ncbi:hypothetical protein DXG01_002070 [Tephrocybe rancida]|nr:hypothetical protein DXG01_002070 [Tephrocybe rancida]